MCGLNNPITFTEHYFITRPFRLRPLFNSRLSYGGDEDQEHAEKACVSGLLVSWTICMCFYYCWPWVCDEYFWSCGNTTHTEELVAYGERGSLGGGTSTKNTQNTEQTTKITVNNPKICVPEFHVVQARAHERMTLTCDASHCSSVHGYI